MSRASSIQQVNRPVYRATPACEQNCPFCEVKCAVMVAVVAQMRADLARAELALRDLGTPALRSRLH